MAFNTNQVSHLALRSIIAEKTDKLVLWIGSGLSVDAGLPTWKELKNSLVARLHDKANDISDPNAVFLKKRANHAENETDHWLAFQILKKNLGPATYKATIREVLSPSTTVCCPDIYHRIWKLRPSGILNLNLDRLATRALTEVTPGCMSTEFAGRYAKNYLHSLRSPHPFIANLHGMADDASSWVLTKKELDQLFKSQGYKTLVRSCLTTTTVLFVGITANDIAVEVHLKSLIDAGIDSGTHYWLTGRRDIATDNWAEEAGIRVIRYENHDDIIECFDDILEFIPEDDPSVPPVILQEPQTNYDGQLPEPSSLMKLPSDQIRMALNGHAMKLLRDEDPESYSVYEEFTEKYDEVIYRAWYTSTTSPDNMLLGYSLLESVARGAFGMVYRAQSPDGSQVAIKVLLNEVRRDRLLLRSFRRGVRSMRYLMKREVLGMVPYRKASEIPAFVVMDWVDGPTLAEAQRAHLIDGWESILQIGLEMTQIIRHAHAIPERVLHRDIRPSNIMLEGFFDRPDAWRVVVLDFDLSWHQGALEQSVIHGPVFGYLAPEQIHNRRGVSTRHAAVDSFGVGMTLYFTISGQDPVPAQHRHKDWAETVLKAALSHESEMWRSLPYRYTRLVTKATQDTQSDRWDMAQIRDEIERLKEAYLFPNRVVSAELLAEEIAARSDRDYSWNEDSGTAIIRLVSGLIVSISGDESRRSVSVNLNWSDSGRQERKNVGKWMAPAADRCKKRLKDSGWRIRACNINPPGSVVLEVTLPVADAATRLKEQTETISRVTEELNFE